MGLAGGHCGRGAAELVAQVMGERVERTGGLLVHHPGPPPLGKPRGKTLRLFKEVVLLPGATPAERELLGPLVLDPAWWGHALARMEGTCNDSSTPTTTPRRTP